MVATKPADRYGGISSQAVLRATGKSWAAWLKILDAAGAADMTHKQIAEHLAEQRSVAPWWSQMVTVGYEQARGRRVKHEKPEGFSVSGSKTVSVPLERLFACWAKPERRAKWLREPLTIRKLTRNKSIRATWSDGSSVDVNFYAKGDEKSMVQVEHAKLSGARAAAQQKAAWKERLGEMAASFEASPLRPPPASSPPRRRVSRKTTRS